MKPIKIHSSAIKDIIAGIDPTTGKKCKLAPCHLIEPGSFCAAMDKAGVPVDANWRALIRFMRGMRDYASMPNADRIAFQNALVALLHDADYSEARYEQTVRLCRSFLVRPVEKMLNEAVNETASLLEHISGVMADRHSELEETKELTISTVIAASAPSEAVNRLKHAFSKLSSAMQHDIKYLQAAAYIDALSDIPNRRAFDEHFAVVCDNWEKKEEPVALIMCDIDRFKLFNDTYGHRVGDQAIKTVASKIRLVIEKYQDINKNLFVARYGGEEFAIICSGPASAYAAEIAETCRSDMESYSFVIRDAKGAVHGEGVQITLSLGVAEAKKGSTSTELLDAADAALYKAKETGRNKVVINKS